MADVVLAGSVAERGGAGTDALEDVLAERHEVAAGFHLAELLGDYPRAAEMIGRRVRDRRGLGDLIRVFRDPLA